MKRISFLLYSKKIILLLIAFSIFSFTKSQCSLGCLSCSDADPENHECKVCDFLNKFALSIEGKCEKKEISNCRVIDFRENSSMCLLCNDGHHFDIETEKCVSIIDDDAIDFCKQYQPDKSCSTCESGYVMDNAVCKDLGEALVENCLHYENMVCKFCNSGYKLNSENKCETFEDEISGCGVYTDVECTKCQDDSQVDYLNLIRQHENVLDEGFKNKLMEIDYSKPMFNPDANLFCKKKQHTNCLKSKDSYECEICENGYYPENSKDCLPNPIDAILECKIYENLETCKECNHQHFLEGDKCSKSTTVDYCTKYHRTLDKCISCESPENSYYLNGTECTLRVNSLEKCLTYSPTADTCLTCDNSKMFLNDSSVCAQRKQITNCSEYLITKDLCSSCDTDFKKTDDSLKCLPKISECKTYQASSETTESFVCDACNDTHYTTDNVTCLLKNIPKCKNYKTGNDLECTTCEANHYPTPAKDACESQSVPYCVEYTPNTNDCVKCENLYYINLKVCSEVDSSLNCLGSDGVENACTECPGDRYINIGSCLARVNPFDENCSKNTNTSDDTKCSHCKEGDVNLLRGLEVISQDDMDAMFCAKIDPIYGTCFQCAENAEGTNTNTCAQAANESSVCLQLESQAYLELDTNVGYCAKCRNYDTHYHDANTKSCIERSKFTSKNCLELDPSADNCLGYPLELEIYDHQKIGQCMSTSEDNHETIPGCLYYDPEDLTSCKVCLPGTPLNDDKKTCNTNAMLSISILTSNAFSKNLNVQITSDHPDYVQNCMLYMYLEKTQKFMCSSCNATFSKIYDFDLTKVSIYPHFPIIACSPENSIKHYKDEEKANIGAQNMYCSGYKYNQEHDSHECINCSISSIAKYGPASFANDGTTEVTKRIIVDCTIEILTPKYGNSINIYPQYENEIELNFINFINPSKCRDPSKKLVGFHPSLNLQDRSIVYPGFLNLETTDSFMCLSNVTNSINNCNWHWAPGVTELTTPDTITVSNCLACEPGYYPVWDPTTRVITACEEILNCSESMENNMCSRCFEGAPIIFNETEYKIKFDYCPQTPPEFAANCRIMGETKCIFCNPKYVPNADGVCEVDTTAATNNCNTTSLLGFNIRPPTNPNEEYTYLYLVMMSRGSSKYPGCSECSQGSKIVTYLTPTYKETSAYESLGKVTLTTIENCRLRKEYSSQKCQECMPDYLLKVDDGTCVEASSVAQSHPNCVTLKTVSEALVCDSCQKTHRINTDTNMCSISTNCLKIGINLTTKQTHCAVCKEGFMYDEENPEICKVNPKADEDICLHYTENDLCLKCKDTTKIPVNFSKGNDLSVSYNLCIESGAENLAFLKTEDYMVFGLIDEDSEKSTIIFSSISLTENFNFLTTSPPMTSAYNPSTLCMAYPQDTNCEESFASHCFKCKDTFVYNNETKNCEEGSIDGCSEYTDKTNCNTCEEGYFKNSQNQCIERTAQNCSGVVSDSNECSACVEGHYLKLNAGDCELDASNCNQCLSYTKNAGCQEMNRNEDVCVNCQDDHYYDKNNTICVRRTKLNCKTSEKEEDKCTSCDSTQLFFKEEEGECVTPTLVDNCSEYNAGINKCAKCNENFFLDIQNNECIPNPDGIPGCIKYKGRTSCDKCGEDMYLENNKCLLAETKVDFCMYYKEDGKCLTCKSTHLIVGDSCTLINNQTCATWKDVDNCETCPFKKVLKRNNDQDDCVTLTISQCDEGKMSGEDMICTKCEDGKLPNDDKQTCVSPEKIIEGCQSYDQSSSKASPKCERCEDRKLLNMAKTECSGPDILKDGKCLHAISLTSNKCMYCGPGYIYKEEGCMTCGGTGCLSCDINDPEKCFICKPQYSMKTKGVCVETYPDVRPISVSILNVFYLAIITMIMFSMNKSE